MKAHSGGLSEVARGHHFVRDVQSGLADCLLVGAAHGDHHSEVHSKEEEFSS